MLTPEEKEAARHASYWKGDFYGSQDTRGRKRL